MNTAFPRYALLAVLAVSCIQMQAAVLSGRVTDPSGAAVADAQVTLQNSAKSVKHAVSSFDGTYVFRDLLPGPYTVSATSPGLALPSPLQVNVASGNLTMNLQLQILVKTQETEVSDSGAPSVTVESAGNAGAVVIKGEDLNALADNPEDLQSDLQALAGPAAGPSGGSIYIDGFSTGQIPPKESIREIRINQDPFSPEFDKLGYGRIEIFTKPGSSKFNGSIGYNFADDFWNARNPYAAQKAPLLLQESENTVGGPLSKRSSFTLEFEQHAVDNGAVINAVTLDPVTLRQTPFTNVFRTIQRHTLVSPRVDYQLNDKNTLTLRYNFTHADVRGAGIGQFDLTSRGYHLTNTFNTLQAGETYVAGSWVNEIRYQYYRWGRATIPDSAGPTVQVLGAFNAGGAQVGNSYDIQNNHELQNYVSFVHGAHTVRFGVRLRDAIDNSAARSSFNGIYTFSSIDSYRLTLAGLQSGLSPAAIRASGGGASQFSITTGNPALSASQFDAGLFAGDSWRIRRNVQLNLGIRYEGQTNVSNHADFSPRIGVAWSPTRTGHHATVVRAGFGMFYDRFALANTVLAQRYNGQLQQQYVLTNPDSYPNAPSAAALTTAKSTQIIQEVASNIRTPYLMQSAVTVEQQMGKAATVTVSYTNAHAVHVLRSEDINAPLPGSGAFRYGTTSPIYLMTSSGVYNQNQLITGANVRPNSLVSLFGYYVFNRAMSNSDGLMTFPSNPYNFSGEYGPAATDIHHRVLFGGSVNTHWNIRVSPYLIYQSGAPFDITTGRDLYGTALFTTRPGIVPSPAAGIVATEYGLLDPNPTSGEEIIGRNAGRGPAQFTTNLRISKTFGFGAEKVSKAQDSAPHIDAARMNATGGLRGLFSAPSSSRRYGLTVGMSVRNLTNHLNAGPIIGNIRSPLFGRANQIAGSPNGEGFSESASNRRLELQLRFVF